MVSHRRQARQAAGGLTLRHPFGATYSRVCPWQPQVPWGNAIRCMGHTPGSASGGRRLIAVTLAQRAATGAMDCNHYAATLAMGQGATMQLARRTCGTCARLDKWLYLRSPWCSVHPQTRVTTTTMQPQAQWAVAVRCMHTAAHVTSFFLPCHELRRFVSTIRRILCAAFAMATLYSVLHRHSQATRDEILQHLLPDEFIALAGANRWLYYHPDIVATKIAAYAAVVEHLVHLIRRLRSLPRMQNH